MVIDTRNMFIDIVKACDIIRYDDMSLAMKKIGEKERHIKWIKNALRFRSCSQCRKG